MFIDDTAFDHPDLQELARTLRQQFDRILAAEQAAALIALQRQSTVRDLLIEAEDSQAQVKVTGLDGRTRSGHLVGVGLDHFVLDSDDQRLIVVFDSVATIELSERPR